METTAGAKLTISVDALYEEHLKWIRNSNLVDKQVVENKEK